MYIACKSEDGFRTPEGTYNFWRAYIFESFHIEQYPICVCALPMSLLIGATCSSMKNMERGSLVLYCLIF
jgi:hypothetical protein